MSEEYFVIRGKKPLSGELEVRGHKNAATPIISACLLTDKPCYIQNLPLVEDIFRMLEIVKELGAEVDFVGKREVKITAKNIDPAKIRKDLVGTLRSSIFLFAPLLSRFREVKIPQPGGCLIGARPIEAHLDGFQQLGAKTERVEGEWRISAKKLKSTEIILSEFSVTATENILMTAASISGKTTIKIAALEPQVKDLSTVLSKMGAEIRWLGDHTIEIKGKKRLNGFSHFLSYDPLEAGSFLILTGATRGKITVKNVPVNYLDSTFRKLKQVGLKFIFKKAENKNKNEKEKIYNIEIKSPKTFYPINKIQVLPYPGLQTDLQCAFGVLATQIPGQTLIHDPMYEGRLNYLKELNRMGADVSLLDVHRAIVRGAARLQGTAIQNYDLRSGAALIIAGLIAHGKTTISNAYQVDRGYERIEERLQKIGADIERIKVKKSN